MNYGELKVYLSAYVNRTDLTDTLFDTWRDMAQTRLLKDMRTVTLDQSVTISNPTGEVVYPYTDDFLFFMQDLVSVSLDASSTQSGYPKPLKAVSWEDFINVQAACQASGWSEPEVYCMFSTGFKVTPGDQADYVFNIVFRAGDNTLNSDTDSNQILTYAPQVYVDAMLIEIYKYLRDVEGEQLATQRYNTETLSYQQYYDWQHSGQNAVSAGSWTWV